jgi:transposase
VLSILAGEVTVAEAARRAKGSRQSVGNWKRHLLESGRAGLVPGMSGPSTRETQLDAEVAELTQALGEPAVELRVQKKSAEGRLGRSRTSSGSGAAGRGLPRRAPGAHELERGACAAW